jgi:hypothetical protein
MIDYLDSVISERIDPCGSDDRSNELSLPSTRHFETDRGYVNALHKYGNAVASKRQMHSQKHNSTCYKYDKKGERTYRFYFPRSVVY